MVIQVTKTHVGGLARRLILENLLDEAVATDAWDESSNSKIPFVTYLVQNNILNSTQIATIAANEFGVPLIDLDTLDIKAIPGKLVSEKLLRKHNAIPLFKRGNRLFVGLSDPTNLQALDEFKFHTGINTDAVVVEEHKLARIIDLILQAQESASIQSNFEDSGVNELVADTTTTDKDDAPIVRYVNKILLDAINSGASDIHFEPYEQLYRIRYRRDGILQEIATPPATLSARLASRLKIMSHMDISERRVPQDGRFKFNLSKNRAIDFRVSSCPTLYGEKIVLRILDPATATMDIAELGYEEKQKQQFLHAIHQPQGMVLVTGPTGSGKTISLYTALGILNTAELNISTAEDPVEINLVGINQVNVNPKAGLSFAAALRCFLRQDPDVVMVGEIRDLETAEIAVKAAQTGHMVLSTLHTNSAPETLTRLMNMGVAPFNIATSVSLIVAQRLARRLCEHCKQAEDLPKQALYAMGLNDHDFGIAVDDMIIYKAVGCPKCQRGYKGRVGIYEILPVTSTIGRIIMGGGNAMDILDQAVAEGMWTLRHSGLKKTVSGLTSLAEINRVTKD